MGVSRKGVLLFAILFLSGALILVFGPVAICAYKQHSFAKNIKVQINVPSCLYVTSASKPCHYLFSFDGERDSQSIQFATVAYGMNMTLENPLSVSAVSE